MDVPWVYLLTRWLLRFAGGIICLSFFAIFLPTEWMAATHQALGLGEFPTTKITLYLARTISAMYFMHGATLLFVSFDVFRFWPLVGLFGLLNLIVGFLFWQIDWQLEMPWWWTWFEGPPIAGFGVLLVCLWFLGRPSGLEERGS